MERRMDKRLFSEIDDSAFVTSWQRDLASIFAALIDEMIAIEQAHIARGPLPLATEILEDALTCVLALRRALKKAKNLATDSSFGKSLSAEGILDNGLPGPLSILLSELTEHYEGRHTLLLNHKYLKKLNEAQNEGENPKDVRIEEPARQLNYRIRSIKAAAAASAQILVENGLRPKDAAKRVSKVLFECGIGTNRTPPGPYLTSTVDEWRKKPFKFKPPFAKIFDDELKELRSAVAQSLSICKPHLTDETEVAENLSKGVLTYLRDHVGRTTYYQ